MAKFPGCSGAMRCLVPPARGRRHPQSWFPAPPVTQWLSDCRRFSDENTLKPPLNGRTERQIFFSLCGLNMSQYQFIGEGLSPQPQILLRSFSDLSDLKRSNLRIRWALLGCGHADAVVLVASTIDTGETNGDVTTPKRHPVVIIVLAKICRRKKSWNNWNTDL